MIDIVDLPQLLGRRMARGEVGVGMAGEGRAAMRALIFWKRKSVIGALSLKRNENTYKRADNNSTIDETNQINQSVTGA
jgi:hypothetical protein